MCSSDLYDQKKVFYLIDSIGYDREGALENHEDVTYYPNMTLEDVAGELVDEGVFGEMTDTIKGYLDYEIGRASCRERV